MKKQLFLLTCLLASTQFVTAQKMSSRDRDSLAATMEVWVNVPLVTPGQSNADAPSDATILYNGHGLSAFQKKMVAQQVGELMQMGLLPMLKEQVI